MSSNQQIEAVAIHEAGHRTVRLLRAGPLWTIDSGDGTLLNGDETAIMAEWTRRVRELVETDAYVDALCDARYARNRIEPPAGHAEREHWREMNRNSNLTSRP